MIPLWASSALHALATIAEFGASLGFAVLVWKVAWASRGWVEAQRTRALNEARILNTLDSMVKLQEQSLAAQREMITRARDMEDRMWAAIGVHTARLRNLEENAREDS